MSDEQERDPSAEAEGLLEGFYLKASGLIDDEADVDPDELRRRRRFRALFWILMILVAFGMFIVGAWIVSIWVEDPPTTTATQPVTSGAVALGACAVPADAWEWEVDVTEETTDRGTRTVGEFRFANRSSEDLRIWWLRSATSGEGDVSEDWQGGAPLAPGGSESAFVSHAVLSDGTESWVVPTHVLAVRDDEACLAAAMAAIEGRSGDDVMVQATPLDLPFGPDAGR